MEVDDEEGGDVLVKLLLTLVVLGRSWGLLPASWWPEAPVEVKEMKRSGG